jgi:ribosomal protein S12 methylthiotransferase accessory factor
VDRLVFTSESTRVSIRGRRFEEFLQHVVPLLDGTRSLQTVVTESSEHFEPDDLRATIGLLAKQGVVIDAGAPGSEPDEARRLGPQLAYLHEVSSDPALVRERLTNARVTVFGLGGIGAIAASALAAAGIGSICCVDDGEVSAADPYLAQLYDSSDVGVARAEAVRARIEAIDPAVSVEVRVDSISSDDDLLRAVEGSDFVLGCLDPGLIAHTDRLNRACLRQRIPWSQASATAFEGIVGPTVIPYETACFACYQSRAVACHDDPQDALRDLEARYADPQDLSAVRENLPFAVGITGHLLALQAFQLITGLRPRSAGRVLVVDIHTSGVSEHVVLRKPWCSACFSPADR